MKRASVSLHWTPSVSDDVVSQRVAVTKGGEEVFNEGVDPTMDMLNVGLFDENDVLSATVFVFDGTHEVASDPVSFQVPDLNEPAPATNVSWTYEVVDEN